MEQATVWWCCWWGMTGKGGGGSLVVLVVVMVVAPRCVAEPSTELMILGLEAWSSGGCLTTVRLAVALPSWCCGDSVYVPIRSGKLSAGVEAWSLSGCLATGFLADALLSRFCGDPVDVPRGRMPGPRVNAWPPIIWRKLCRHGVALWMLGHHLPSGCFTVIVFVEARSTSQSN
jgi:hypothetical protein